MAAKGKIKNLLPALILVILTIGGWELITSYTAIPDYILPAPSAIIRSLVNNFRLLIYHSGYTFAAV
jgi:ABC-type nitrate/sulfonate/bicarbonate transport system permease component